MLRVHDNLVFATNTTVTDLLIVLLLICSLYYFPRIALPLPIAITATYRVCYIERDMIVITTNRVPP
jgi:hypothetical protein